MVISFSESGETDTNKRDRAKHAGDVISMVAHDGIIPSGPHSGHARTESGHHGRPERNRKVPDRQAGRAIPATGEPRAADPNDYRTCYSSLFETERRRERDAARLGFTGVCRAGHCAAGPTTPTRDVQPRAMTEATFRMIVAELSMALTRIGFREGWQTDRQVVGETAGRKPGQNRWQYGWRSSSGTFCLTAIRQAPLNRQFGEFWLSERSEGGQTLRRTTSRTLQPPRRKCMAVEVAPRERSLLGARPSNASLELLPGPGFVNLGRCRFLTVEHRHSALILDASITWKASLKD